MALAYELFISIHHMHLKNESVEGSMKQTGTSPCNHVVESPVWLPEYMTKFKPRVVEIITAAYRL